MSSIDKFLEVEKQKHQSQEPVPDEDDRSWQLNPEIRALTRETDELLDEMKQVGVPTPSYGGLRYESDDDASLKDEINGLDSAADEMREAMETELRQRRRTNNASENTSSFSPARAKNKREATEENTDEQLLLYATIILALNLFLAMYVKFLIFDENGNFRFFNW